MKIVYCIPSCYNSGGMERVLSTKTNYLAEKVGYDVFIVTTGQKGKRPYYHFSEKIHFVDLNINYDDIESDSVVSKTLKMFLKKIEHERKLKKLLYELNSDVVVSMFTHEASFLYKIKDSSKKILELHFSKHFRDLHNRYNNAGILKRIISRYLNLRDFHAAKHYDKFVVLTEKDKRDWRGYRNIEVISNPLSFKITNDNVSRTKNIICVGRLCPQKGFDLMIDVWRRVRDDIRNTWHVSIYGSGPDYGKLESLINENNLKNSVTIIEPVKDIENVYRNGSIMCFTSRYEGLPMALLEAMAYGMGCISFDCPCGPSDMIVNGYNGVLVEPFDVETFAKNLEAMIDDENRRIMFGENATKTILSHYTEDVIMQKWIELFKTI